MAWYFKVLTCIAAYLVGSINFAVIIAKIKHMNIKEVGSKNPGTMNVIRSVGKGWGALTFALDCLKAVMFSAIGRFCVQSQDNILWAVVFGAFVILGHVFPIFTKFKGGKGVASTIGLFLVIFPIETIIALVVFVLFLMLCKYGFIGSILTVAFLTIYTSIRYADNYIIAIICVIILIVVIVAHRSNIVRLIKGNENELNIIGKNKTEEENKKEKIEEKKEDK